MKIRRKRQSHLKGPKGEKSQLGKFKKQGEKHLQCALRVNGKEKNRMKIGMLNGDNYVGFCEQGERIWILYMHKGRPSDGFNGENDFIFGERLREAKAEAKLILENLVIAKGGSGY